MSIGTLALRLTVGGFVAAHGLQKLRGSFGGPGLSGTEKMMESLEMHPAALQARAVAFTETVGGLALAAGAATPLAAAGVIGAMVTAVRKVHLKNGPWNSNGGFEFNAVLIAAAVAIAADGPGLISLDAIAGKKKWGVLGGLFALGAGVAASFAITEAAKRLAPEVEDEDEVEASVA
jgi:putative oxidoreductase